MIRLLKGVIESCDEDGVILDVNGIGFFVFLPKIMLTEMQKGQAITLHVYMCIKPEQLSLYGFLDVSMRAWFLLLLSVQGVGPKTALNILSTL
jgi:Holliday junction DNA helicase RuvA